MLPKLPWIPRPLVIFAHLGKGIAPCIQWYGEGPGGNISEQQMLFPIYGKGAEVVNEVKPECWRIHSVDRDLVHLVGPGHDVSVFVGWTYSSERVPFLPQQYKNEEVVGELPQHELDKRYQAAWRVPYLIPQHPNIEEAVERVCGELFGGYRTFQIIK